MYPTVLDSFTKPTPQTIRAAGVGVSPAQLVSSLIDSIRLVETAIGLASPSVYTADSTVDIFTSNGHGLSNNDIVSLTSSLAPPAGLLVSTPYFVVNATTNTFQLSLTRGGAVINFTDNGTGVNAVVQLYSENKYLLSTTNGVTKWGTIGGISLTSGVTGILPIGNGGTGSATQNFVDLSSTQSNIAGNKTFTGAVTLSANMRMSNTASVTAATVNLATTSNTLQPADSTLNAQTFNLPATVVAGLHFWFKKVDGTANPTTIAATSIDGVANWVLSNQNDYLIVVSTTTSGVWRVFSSSLRPTGVTPGVYTNANITIGADGRITLAANGTGGGGGSGKTYYTTVVDAAGGGDYTSLGAAITAGATNIFIRSGNYSEAAAINAGQVTIVGENPETTFIAFTGNFGLNLTADYSYVSNLKIQNAGTANYALRVDGNFCTVERCHLTSTVASSRIYQVRGSYSVTIGCIFEAQFNTSNVMFSWNNAFSAVQSRIVNNRFIVNSGNTGPLAQIQHDQSSFIGNTINVNSSNSGAQTFLEIGNSGCIISSNVFYSAQALAQVAVSVLAAATNTILYPNSYIGFVTAVNDAGTGTILPPASSFVGLSDVQTLTNKRITRRFNTSATPTAPTMNTNLFDGYIITALANTCAFPAPTGAPTNGQNFIIRVKDAGTAQALTWDPIFRSVGAGLPNTTVAGKTMYVGFSYNTADTKWDCVAWSQES